MLPRSQTPSPKSPCTPRCWRSAGLHECARPSAQQALVTPGAGDWRQRAWGHRQFGMEGTGHGWRTPLRVGPWILSPQYDRLCTVTLRACTLTAPWLRAHSHKRAHAMRGRGAQTAVRLSSGDIWGVAWLPRLGTLACVTWAEPYCSCARAVCVCVSGPEGPEVKTGRGGRRATVTFLIYNL